MNRNSLITFTRSILYSIYKLRLHEPALGAMIEYYLAGNTNDKYSAKTIYLQLYKLVYEHLSSIYSQMMYADIEASKVSDANLDGQPVYKHFKSGLMDKTILSVIRNQNMFGIHEQLNDEDLKKAIHILLWIYVNCFSFIEEYHAFEANKFSKKKKGNEFFNE